MDDPITLYLVHNSDEEDKDWFIAARTPSEALAIWRRDIADCDLDEDQEPRLLGATVFPVPDVPAAPGTVSWPHDSATVYADGYQDLTTMAVDREAEGTQDESVA